MSTQNPNPVDAAIRAVAGGVGTALGAVFAVTARLRRDKPLHPEGSVAPATLTVVPAPTPSGVPLLDEPGEHPCVVRASQAMGTGPEWSDIEGFALRLLPGERHTQAADLLFASTGAGPVTRYALALRRPAVHGTQTTLLPIEAGGHPLVLRIEPVDRTPPGAPGAEPWWPSRYELSWAHGLGPWHSCADLVVDWAGAADERERFDPIANELPGTSQYLAVRWLREPSYALSRWAWPRAGHLPERHP